jgi:single-strand DNA-binding protein
MSQENKITLRGYLTADPTFYQKTAEAVPLTEIRLGSTPRRLNRATGEWQDGPTTYYRVKCWRRLAASAKSSLSKGDRVIIFGNLSLSNWVDNQQRPRTSVEVEAESIGPDLAHGWAVYHKGARSSENDSGSNSGEAASPEASAGFEDATPAADDSAATGAIEALARDIDALDREPVPF